MAESVVAMAKGRMAAVEDRGEDERDAPKPAERIRRDSAWRRRGTRRLEWLILYPRAVIRIEFSALPGNSIGNAIRAAKVILGRVEHDPTVNNLRVSSLYLREGLLEGESFPPEFSLASARSAPPDNRRPE